MRVDLLDQEPIDGPSLGAGAAVTMPVLGLLGRQQVMRTVDLNVVAQCHNREVGFRDHPAALTNGVRTGVQAKARGSHHVAHHTAGTGFRPGMGQLAA